MTHLDQMGLPVASAAAGTDSAFRSGSWIPSASTAWKKGLLRSASSGRKLKSWPSQQSISVEAKPAASSEARSATANATFPPAT